MLQYALTVLAGIAVGVAGMRVWMATRSQAEAAPTGPAQPAAEDVPARAASRVPSTGTLLLGASAIAMAGAVVLAVRQPDAAGGNAGQPFRADAPAATAGGASGLPDVDTMITSLEDRLKANPGDGDGWRMLGWSLLMTGHPDRALAPYRKALALLPDNASVLEGYGEALAGAAGGTVTPEAKAAFDKALARDAAAPRARYFEGKWLVQQGRARDAVEKWLVLANEGPADAPWQADLRRDLEAAARTLGIDVAGRLKHAAAPAVAPPTGMAGTAAGMAGGVTGAMPAVDPAAADAAGRMSPQDRDRMIGGMVDGLARRLRANPADPEGWARLLRSRMVLRQTGRAGEELAAARKALAGNGPGLAKINAVARELGVPGA
ncbi:MAG: hypothetical protein KGM17_10695 [Sphingomonadales bacterium]|nr:hypothetical protein [Sphingomonadales bacterium]